MKHERWLRVQRESEALQAWARALKIEQAVQDERWLPVIPVDRLIHTDERPFCDAVECPCHSDMSPEALDIYRAAIMQYKQDGLLTDAEGDRMFLDQQI